MTWCVHYHFEVFLHLSSLPSLWEGAVEALVVVDPLEGYVHMSFQVIKESNVNAGWKNQFRKLWQF